MPQERTIATRAKLVETGSDLIRRKGFIATRIDDICEVAGVTKGGFFHHFKTKEELAEACLIEWSRKTSEMLAKAPFQKETDPTRRVLGCIDFLIQLFDSPHTLKSCLVGTTVQEVSETHPELRNTAGRCFEQMKDRLKAMLDEACRSTGKRLDTDSLADLWIATLQGSLILYKASRDPAVIRKNLRHTKKYIAGQLAPIDNRKEENHVTRTIHARRVRGASADHS